MRSLALGEKDFCSSLSLWEGNNILDSTPCGLRVDWSYVRVFSWFALQMNHENQTTKSHEPGITKRHKGPPDESSMLLPLKRFFISNIRANHRAKATGVNETLPKIKLHH